MESSILGPWNADTIESAYQLWRQDPASVDASWPALFAELGLTGPESANASAKQQSVAAQADTTASDDTSGMIRLIDAYRELGHMLARLDPLSDPPQSIS